MTFNLNVLEECLHVQYEVIFCRNNIMAVFCIFANSSRILCTLVTGEGGGGGGVTNGLCTVQDFSDVCERV